MSVSLSLEILLITAGFHVFNLMIICEYLDPQFFLCIDGNWLYRYFSLQSLNFRFVIFIAMCLILPPLHVTFLTNLVVPSLSHTIPIYIKIFQRYFWSITNHIILIFLYYFNILLIVIVDCGVRSIYPMYILKEKYF